MTAGESDVKPATAPAADSGAGEATEPGAGGSRLGRTLGGIVHGQGLKARAMRGSAWTVIGIGGKHAIQLGRNLILTRLLLEAHFGLMAIVGIINQGLQLFTDMGLIPSIVQNPRGDETNFLNTAWTVQVVRGAILWLLACGLAWPLATLYDQPILARLIPVAGFALLISGFNSTNLATARRHITLAREQTINLLAPIAGLVVAVPLAWHYHSVWALVAAALAGATTKMVLSHTALPGIRNRFHWDPTAWRELFHFGKWIFLATVATFFVTRGDRLILGGLISMDRLGVYTIAFMIVEAPRQVMRHFGGNVIFPAVARRQDLTRADLRQMVSRNRRPILFAGAAGAALLASLADLLVIGLWPPDFHEAGWMAATLALGLWPEILQTTADPVLRGLGKPKYASAAQMMRLITLGVALPLLTIYFGMRGAVLAVMLQAFTGYPIILGGMIRHRMNRLRDEALATGLLVGVIAAAISIRALCGLGLPWV